MSGASGKVVVQVESPAEQEEHQRNSRKLLKEVQNVSAMNKENVLKTVKLPAFLAHQALVAKKNLLTTSSDATEAVEQKRKKLVQSQSSQTSPTKSVQQPQQQPECSSPPVITEEDLTSAEGPSQGYYEILAEKRRIALGESLEENQQLYDRITDLEEELNTSKQMLQEARNLVEVLTEMLQEGEAEKEEAAAATKPAAGENQVDDSGVVPELPSDAEEDEL